MPKIVPFACRLRRTLLPPQAHDRQTEGTSLNAFYTSITWGIKIGVDRHLRWSRATEFEFAYGPQNAKAVTADTTLQWGVAYSVTQKQHDAIFYSTRVRRLKFTLRK